MSTPRQLKIAFGYKARSGKDTAVDYITSKYSTHVVRFASPLYDIMWYGQRRVGVSPHKDTRVLQCIGQLFRDVYGDDIWIRSALSELPDDVEVIVVADLRYRSEANILKKLGFHLVRIIRDDRPIDRDPNHSSEVDLDNYPFDDTIVNNGTISELGVKVQLIIDKLYRDSQ